MDESHLGRSPTCEKAQMNTTDTTGVRLAISPAEAARILGCGRTKFYELLASGEIRSFHIGRRRLIRLAAIEAWITSKETGA